MPRFIHIAAINVLVVVGLLLLIEGCVRVMNPEIRPLGMDGALVADSVYGDAPGPRPLASGVSNGARFQVDADGFWIYGARRDSTAAAWLLLGDSVTMGVGVEPDRTFAGRIAAARPDLRVANPSLVGHSVQDYAEILADLVDRREPLERVTLLWCLNDIYTRGAGAGSPDAEREATTDPDQRVRRITGPVLGFLHRHIYTYQWLKSVALDRPRRYFEYDSALYESEQFNAASRYLGEISTLCDEENLRCEIVLLPYEYQLRAAASVDVFRPQQRIRSRAEALNLPVVDAAPYLLENGARSTELYLYGDGIHFSERGHELLAEFILALPAEREVAEKYSSAFSAHGQP